MIQALLDGSYTRIRLHQVRLAFSATIADIGRVRPGKLLHLASVVGRIIAARLQHGCRVLYYPPSGPNRVPLYRDIAILSAVRPWFERTVFHFHAGGVTDLLPELSAPERLLFRRAFMRPDGAIVLSEHAPPDGRRLGARLDFVIPYGIEDHARHHERRWAASGSPPAILFVGALRRSKGVAVLLEAARLLKQRGLAFRVQFMGSFASADFETEVRRYVTDSGLDDEVSWLGERTGRDKWQTYADADIFCFPSFYESETFGLVVVEAMQFRLPVVATRWRGIPSHIRDGDSGFVVEPRDPIAVADRLGELLVDPDKARLMGERGREIYLDRYRLEHWHQRMEEALVAVASL